MAYRTLHLPKAFVMCQRLNVIAGRDGALMVDRDIGARVLGGSCAGIHSWYFALLLNDWPPFPWLLLVMIGCGKSSES